LRIAGTRLLVIRSTYEEGKSTGAVFESAAGDRLVLAAARNRANADEIAALSGPGSIILSVEPPWSFPAETRIDADPEFRRGTRERSRPSS
jgi:hypothetical protein